MPALTKIAKGQYNPRKLYDPYNRKNPTLNGVPLDLDLDDLDVNTIRARTPVITGMLRRNFHIENGVIINETLYGDYVERGTSKMAPRFMVARSIPIIARRLAFRVVRQLETKKILDLPTR